MYFNLMLSLSILKSAGYEQMKKSDRNIDLTVKNYNYKDSEFDRGFIQGVLLASLSEIKEPVIPKRYIEALKKLASDDHIYISSADKGGGIVILDKSTYNTKMEILLKDTNTYEMISETIYKNNMKEATKCARNTLSNAPGGKSMLHLLPKVHFPAYIYGLPKLHKPNVPLRPIVSGVGSLLHQLARKLAKTISGKVGTISGKNLKHSGDLINRIENISMKNKQMASFDIVSLFSNVPTKKAIEVLTNVLSEHDELPVPV
ncbi:uncharacterized protein LOC143034761 [Oratosquilla oratoria]|uniref:uncharacterized protein LOC143034761 n=1 Tax=Oratosquilla oratoria TaxID=337810 RepID=UPI003F76C038